ITAGVTCYFLPREYFSKVTMEVKSDDSRGQIFGSDNGSHEAGSKLSPTTFQIIQRKEILYPVIENLKLADTWGGPGNKLAKEQAYGMLLGKLELREVRNTDLLEIGAYSTDPQEAANNANTIAVVYQAR